jgi:two-component system, chemotaxis family, chemotaxis protein CheY
MSTILIVDDEPMVRQMLRNMLQLAGYELDEASDGIEGLGCCARRRYDLVIVDLMMPNKDGLEMIAELRHADPSARILALSGWTDPKVDLLAAAAKLGADGVSSKPFDVLAFLNQIQTLLAPCQVKAGSR